MGIFSSIFGAKALKKANANASIAQTQAYNEASGMFSPYKEAGTLSLKAYLDSIGLGDSNASIENFKNSPNYRLNYDAAMKSGQEAVGAMGNAAGLRNSGATLRALAEDATRRNNNFFQQYQQPLAAGANTGLGVTNTLADLRMGEGQNKANYFMNKGQIKAGQMAGFDGLLSDAISLGSMGFGGGLQGIGEKFGFAKSLY